MDIEEAIGWLENISEKYIHGGDEKFDKQRKRAIIWAIDALRFQQTNMKLDKKKWEGCEDCTGYMNKSVCWNFRYCPNCGRPRTDEALKELERRINDN